MIGALSPDRYLDDARDLARDLEARDKRRAGGNKREVRGRVASRVGVAPGTLETLQRGRLKRLETWVYARLARAAIDDLEAEIRNHETELARASRCLGGVGTREVGEIRQHLDELREALSGLSGKPGAGSAASDRPAECPIGGGRGRG